MLENPKLAAGLPIPCNLVPLSPTIARTDAENVFTENQIFGGRYNHVTGECLDFIRPNGGTPSWIRFYRKDKPETEFWAIGSDFAFNGDYYVLAYDSVLDLDLLRIGFNNENRGKFGLGADMVNPNTQLQIHDIDEKVTNSVRTWSWHNGFFQDSRAQHCDSFTLYRGGFGSRWLTFSQGDTRNDWRFGMDPISYDFVVLRAPGVNLSDAENPGAEVLRIKADGTIVGNGAGLTNVPASQSLLDKISELEARIKALENRT